MHKKIEEVIKRLVGNVLSKDISQIEEVDVYKGSLSRSLLLSLLCKYDQDFINKNYLYDSVSHCINNLEILGGNASLSGYSGVLLTLNILIQEDQIEKGEVEELINTLQNLIIQSISYDFQSSYLDFLHGLIGKLITLAESKHLLREDKKSFAEENVQKGIRFILDNAKYTENNAEVFWQTNYTADDIINTGLAHGLASIINFLAKAYDYDFIDIDLRQEIRDTIRLACNFLINRKSSNSGYFTFPNKISKSGKELNIAKYHLAWCHGELGIIFSLIAANKCLNSQKVTMLISSMIKNLSKIDVTNSGIRQNITRIDTTLCHGSFGAFFLFYLLYKHTKLPQAKNAYIYWLNENLSYVDWDQKFLGLSHCNININTGDQEWGQSSGFLFGAIGQCLSILSFLLVEKDLMNIPDLNWLKFLF